MQSRASGSDLHSADLIAASGLATTVDAVESCATSGGYCTAAGSRTDLQVPRWRKLADRRAGERNGRLAPRSSGDGTSFRELRARVGSNVAGPSRSSGKWQACSSVRPGPSTLWWRFDADTTREMKFEKIEPVEHPWA